MLIKKASDIKSSDITPKHCYLNRRKLIAGMGVAAMGAGMAHAKKLDYKPYPGEAPGELTDYDDITSYNNFYEFGFDKADPKKYAHEMTVDPWSVKIDGMVNNPGNYALEDLIDENALEERIYRLRCVETWSMVVPWIGIPLADVIKKADPTGDAKFVAFETVFRPEEIRGQMGLFQSLEWPYHEGLRLDEAMNPLTILATGLYGETLPNQNGAPLRLVVPWKYGFKSIKSIVRMSFTDTQPGSSWNDQSPSEYGFYSNVNPNVSHPRWSQEYERPVGGGLFAKKRETQMFNGYADEVASLYAGMDLEKNF